MQLVWNKTNKLIKDESGSSFIFSLTNNHKFTLDKSKDAIHAHTSLGPAFGGSGPDFYLSEFANNNDSSCTMINKSYFNENYTVGNKDSYMKFNGNPDKHYKAK